MRAARVLQMLGSADDGGAETYFIELIRALDQAGLPQAAAIRAHAGREAALATLGAPVRVLPFERWQQPLTQVLAARFAREIDADVIVSWMSRASAATPNGPWAKIGRLGGYYNLRYFRRHDLLVANTQDLVRYIDAGGWPRSKVRYIPNFATPDGHSALDRTALDTPQGVPLLLGMGRLHYDKAHDIALRALTRLPEAWLWIAGSGPLERELKALAVQLGVADRVRFLGWREDAGALYRAADVVVFPSRIEPLGNVVIQAWAYGKPLVTAASIGPAALVRDQEDALLVPIDDDAALAAAIQRVLTEPGLAPRLVDAGAARATEFSQAAVVAEWQDAFQQVRRR
jgi:glycosyltransferase involved in cell wall biosynthesis